MLSNIKRVLGLKVMLVLMLSLSGFCSFASDVANLQNFNDYHWYQQSYVWTVGGSVLVLLLLAFLSNNHIDKAIKD